MYIIIIGGGQVGYYLSRALINEGHEILVIEKSTGRSDFICSELGSVCMRGDGCETATLSEAGTGRADMLIAVTGDDEDNLVACQLAKHKFNVPFTIARISNPKNETLFKKLGIDVTVSSTNVIMEYIQQEVPTHPLTHLMTLRDRGLEVVEIKIPSGSTNVGKRIKDIILPKGSFLSLIVSKQQKPHMPISSTVIQPDDQIIAVTTPQAEDALRTALRGDSQTPAEQLP